MLVVSRDPAWVARLGRLASRAGWPIEARERAPERPGDAREKSLVVIDRALAGGDLARALARLRSAVPGAAVALACADGDGAPQALGRLLEAGADETVFKTWDDARLAARLSDAGATHSSERVAADGLLRLDRRARRVYARRARVLRALDIDARGFELLWRLAERDGEVVSRADLADTLSREFEREAGPQAVVRRIAALNKVLAPLGAAVESAGAGRYRLSRSRRRSMT